MGVAQEGMEVQEEAAYFVCNCRDNGKKCILEQHT